MSSPRNNRFEIIQPGISISSKFSTNGTIGLIVYDLKNNNNPCILSNWHIIARKGYYVRRGKWPIYQPGRAVQGKVSKNIIAEYVRHHKGTDSAIAKIISRDFEVKQYETNAIITSTRIPKKGDIVEKSGVKTGITRAVIDKVNGSRVKMIPITKDPDYEISMSGDSGSIWYDPKTMEGLVLHNHGENSKSNNERAWGWSLVTVMQKLDISLTS